MTTIDDMNVINAVDEMAYEEMTGLQEKQLMQKHFIRKYGVRSSILDVVIDVLKILSIKKEEKQKNGRRRKNANSRK